VVKGGKDRTVYLPSVAVSVVSDWLTVRGKSGALLCPVRKGSTVELRHLTAQAVLLIVQKRAASAGSPRSLHMIFGGLSADHLDAGTDIVTVQKLAGHASPITTAKYDRRGEEVKRWSDS